MSSRQEEKEARKRARIEQEEAERRSATRNKRLQMVLGAVFAVGIVAAVVIALISAGGGGDSGGPKQASASGSSTLPEPQITDVKAAAQAAGCTLSNPPDGGRGHESRKFTEADYDANPPTSGAHFPQAAQDGIYEPANTPPLGELVHTLEHGRIDVQYKSGTDPALVSQLEAFVGENDGYHMLLVENSTNMQPQVAATAWDHSLSCPSPGPKLWDALRTFRDANLDKAPEQIP